MEEKTTLDAESFISPWAGEWSQSAWDASTADIRTKHEVTNEQMRQLIGTYDELTAAAIEEALSPHFSVVRPHVAIEQQTAKHLLALDSSLEEAVGKVRSESRWKWAKSNDGGGGAYVTAGAFYLRSSNRDFVEMVSAFLSGDILTALQKRDEVNEQVFQSSP